MGNWNAKSNNILCVVVVCATIYGVTTIMDAMQLYHMIIRSLCLCTSSATSIYILFLLILYVVYCKYVTNMVRSIYVAEENVSDFARGYFQLNNQKEKLIRSRMA